MGKPFLCYDTRLFPVSQFYIWVQLLLMHMLVLGLHRTLYGANGRFVVDNINEWQHSAMYAAFLLSGLVDLVGFYAPRGSLPGGSEQVLVMIFQPLQNKQHALPSRHAMS